MRFWLRELAGWLLILAGLYFCLISIDLVTSRPSFVFNAIHTTVIGIFIFRGGIHLLKVALAARMCTAPQATKTTVAPKTAPRPSVPIAADW